MNLFMAEQNGVQVFGVAKDADDFHDVIVKDAEAGKIAPTFGYLHFSIQEITVPGYDIVIRKQKGA
ncbi:hypothetical protein ACFLFF_26950 [Brevibacillus reuszeri]|uniref:hypothetical protein n=1 Tax=Brevibacillus reuszeri TaxID=54915 RepID=UPI00366F2972